MAVSTHFFRLSLCASHPTLAVLSRVPRRPHRRHPCTGVAARHLPLACNAVYGKHSGTAVQQLTLCNKVRATVFVVLLSRSGRIARQTTFQAWIAAPQHCQCSASQHAAHGCAIWGPSIASARCIVRRARSPTLLSLPLPAKKIDLSCPEPNTLRIAMRAILAADEFSV